MAQIVCNSLSEAHFARSKKNSNHSLLSLLGSADSLISGNVLSSMFSILVCLIDSSIINLFNALQERSLSFNWFVAVISSASASALAFLLILVGSYKIPAAFAILVMSVFIGSASLPRSTSENPSAII